MSTIKSSKDVILIFRDFDPSAYCLSGDISLFKIDESHYKAQDVHYKIGLKNLTEYGGKPDYYTSDLKSMIDRINADCDPEIKMGFYSKDGGISGFGSLSKSAGLVMLQSKVDESKCILINFKGNDVSLIFDSSDFSLKADGDVLEQIDRLSVLSSYNADLLTLQRTYLKDRVAECYENL